MIVKTKDLCIYEIQPFCSIERRATRDRPENEEELRWNGSKAKGTGRDRLRLFQPSVDDLTSPLASLSGCSLPNLCRERITRSLEKSREAFERLSALCCREDERRQEEMKKQTRCGAHHEPSRNVEVPGSGAKASPDPDPAREVQAKVLSPSLVSTAQASRNG